jgi:hypothetical protein
MPGYFFILLRFWLRVDGVLFRCLETRIYHEYSKDYLIREFQIKESGYKAIAAVRVIQCVSNYLDAAPRSTNEDHRR